MIAKQFNSKAKHTYNGFWFSFILWMGNNFEEMALSGTTPNFFNIQ